MMSVSLFLVSLLAGGALSANPLPDYMIGTFVLDTSEGFNVYMSALGVDFFTRTIACALTPTATNKQTSSGDITIDTSSTFKSTSVTFQLNTPFEESTADGRTVNTTAVLNGNKLVKTQVGEPISIETREFVDGGNKMNLIHTLPSDPDIKSFRVYVKQ
eukprot:GFUD01014502.1.p1 GENE.GFUD01014502.1~~GFUD01014502.1.p1  ORF type:complete len:159 (-),score=46.47 GFUD01014502.1:292-768(-)